MSIQKFTVNNPISDGWYADPEARFYEGKYWIYATISNEFKQQKNQICFSSEDLTNWEQHDNILDMSTFPWVWQAIWAPTIVEKGGKYYYIFASNDIHSDDEPGGLELAVSDSPAGPFKAVLDRPLVGEFHNGAQPIDAHLFKDDDGTVYLLYGGWKHCNLCIMNDEMNGLNPFPDGTVFKEITPYDYVEGPCMFKRNGKYYFMWSGGGWTDGTYRVSVAFADTPWGPFENPVKVLCTGDCTFANGPGHNGYLYLEEHDLFLNVYHRHSNEINHGNARFLCIDVMEFDPDGNAKPVTMTKKWAFDNGKITVLDPKAEEENA